jgi:RNA polymerase sigma factor (sigma-70 family)
METLCRTYWFPLCAWIRRQGQQPADAEDLTQGFIEHLLEHDPFRNVTAEKGRFRAFLLGAFQHYLTDTQRSAKALKRGGGASFLSLDAPQVEERYIRERVDQLSPDQVYERRWVLAVIEAVLNRLGNEAIAAGNGALFKQTRNSILGDRNSPPYAEIAQPLGMSEGAVRVAVHRLRNRYRELFIEEITQTVSRPEEVEEEVAYLLHVLGG